MEKQNLFMWKHYQPNISLLTVKWYLGYNLSFLDLVEMMEKRFIRKRVRSTLGLKSFRTATYILNGIKAMNTVKKAQPHHGEKFVRNEVEFIHKLF